MKSDSDKSETVTKPEAQGALAATHGSDARCEWLTTLDGQEICGEPATHAGRNGVKYCPTHAALAGRYVEIRPLNPKPPMPVSSSEKAICRLQTAINAIIDGRHKDAYMECQAALRSNEKS